LQVFLTKAGFTPGFDQPGAAIYLADLQAKLCEGKAALAQIMMALSARICPLEEPYSTTAASAWQAHESADRAEGG
jgi:hypothetical protein